MANQPIFANNTPLMRCIHFGRLVSEKGSDIIVDLAEQILLHSETRIVLDIYGDGPFGEEILRKFSNRVGFFDGTKEGSVPEIGYRVGYHGYRPKSVIQAALRESHYLLMPSRFLETFGLSALESISEGVPVVAFSQGGLKQFLQSKHAITPRRDESQNSCNFIARVAELLEVFRLDTWHIESDTAKSISARYSKDHWKTSIKKHIPPHVQKILLVTDYAHYVGGIEAHVYEIMGTLREMGYQVDVYTPMKGTSRWVRYIGIILSFCNVFAYIGFKKKIAEFSPDLIWYHSVSRAIGPIGLMADSQSKILRSKTYHDLGYFGPFATEYTNEEEFIHQDFSLSTFLRQSAWWKWFYVVLKYYKLVYLFRIFRIYNLHIIPSEFMKSSLVRIIEDDSKILTLPHTYDL
jgi:glycosyltransferase involved in cell wall biosynthesis